MIRHWNIIGGIVSLRRSLVCRTFALLFLALIVSPVTAPFATFDLVAIVDAVEGGEESVKTAIDVTRDDHMPGEVLMPLMTAMGPALVPAVSPADPTSFQAVLRI